MEDINDTCMTTITTTAAWDWAFVNRLNAAMRKPMRAVRLPLSFDMLTASAVRLSYDAELASIVGATLLEWFQLSCWTIQYEGDANPAGFRASRRDSRSITVSVQFFQNRDDQDGIVCDILRYAGCRFRFQAVLQSIRSNIVSQSSLGLRVSIWPQHTAAQVAPTATGALKLPFLIGDDFQHSSMQPTSKHAFGIRSLERVAQQYTLGLVHTDSIQQSTAHSMHLYAADEYLTRVAESVRDGGVADIGDQVAMLCESDLSARDILEQQGPVTLLDQLTDCLGDEESPWFLHSVYAFAALAKHTAHHSVLLELNVHRFFALYVRKTYRGAPFGRLQLYSDSLNGLLRLVQSSQGLAALRVTEQRAKGLSHIAIPHDCFRKSDLQFIVDCIGFENSRKTSPSQRCTPPWPPSIKR